MSLFDPDEGARRAQEGAERAWDAADAEWRVRAAEIIEYMARSSPTGFTSDDVMARLDQEGFSTHEPRALGALFRSASHRHLIEKVGIEESRRPQRHRGTVTRWRGCD